jgi:hypothetical protein
MKILEIIFVASMLCVIIYLAGFYGRNESKVYVCHEVTKLDPKDVQDMCKLLKRKY